MHVRMVGLMSVGMRLTDQRAGVIAFSCFPTAFKHTWAVAQFPAQPA
jgi:hypothetical protein